MSQLLLKPFYNHPIVNALINQANNVAALSLDQEALLFSATYLKIDQPLVIVKEIGRAHV